MPLMNMYVYPFLVSGQENMSGEKKSPRTPLSTRTFNNLIDIHLCFWLPCIFGCLPQLLLRVNLWRRSRFLKWIMGAVISTNGGICYQFSTVAYAPYTH
ncbi:hypothetical protein BABINDRAFT_82883 [Babjeviella inositovora NRRL Y-12698]|uniref:Uncharacterized protein n=1 Tax=Babjeviella inositovora NRRL Y-12698 TaxID=984486 RepID=A0A1E3QMN5_9ASCO|nr:uncharacterized protein BABINDRAFT_82883 [Babjeviella inositovora NRRL Y-12698]ODQ78352.1 hypothetical protein BABINDRAFT_82883 [Babjeviella inositovora NRRL Y-12698]